MSLAVELEMVDGRLHRALHLGAQRRHDLVVLDGNRPPTFGQAQLLQALLHNAHRLAHLLHADAVAVVIVAVLADRDVEIELGITFVGLRLAQIPGGAGAAHHDTGKPPTPGICELDHGDTDVALLEDTIFRQQPLDVVADLEGRDRRTPRCRRGASAVSLGTLLRSENSSRACESPRHARKTPSASRAPRSPITAA